MTSLLVSTLVMGTLTALVAVAIVRSRRWEVYSPGLSGVQQRQDDPVTQADDAGRSTDESGRSSNDTERSSADTERSLTETPLAWIVGFVGLVALAVGGVFLFVTSPDAPSELFSGPILAIGALFVVAYLLAGTYYVARSRGHPSSFAAAECIAVLCVLYLIAVSTRLIG